MAGGKFYEAPPQLAPAVIFAVLYTSTCAVTIWQYISRRAWFFLFMVIASIMESVGYITKCFSPSNMDSLPIYITQYLLIFLAPAIMAASVYMAMGRLVLHVTPPDQRTMKNLWVTPRAMTPVFVSCDILAFLVQLLGGVQSTADSTKTKKLGFNIMKIGLAVQLICFGLFIVISFRFHSVSKRFQASWPDTRWVRFLWVINISGLLIFVRSGYRMIEFATGFDGYLATHEWNFYVFESSVVLPVFILFNVFHPSYYVSNVSWKQKREYMEMS